MSEARPPAESETPAPAIRVAPSPHLSDTGLSTRRMMIDVLIALAPVLVTAVVVFGWRRRLEKIGVPRRRLRGGRKHGQETDE